MRTVQRTFVLRSVASGPQTGPRERAPLRPLVRGLLLFASFGLLSAALVLLFREGQREAARIAAVEASREAERSGAAAHKGGSAGELAAARISVSVSSNPPGARVRLSDGERRGAAIIDAETLTPAQIQVPRSSEPLTLVLSKPGFQDETLVVTPDVPREHFVVLQAEGASDNRGAAAALATGGAPPAEPSAPAEAESDGPRILLERLVDTYLDARLRGCCQEAGPCGHVLLEGAVNAAGRISRLQVHLNPPQPQATRCINGVLRAARRMRVPPDEAQPFLRSYSFDAPSGSVVASGDPKSTPAAAPPRAAAAGVPASTESVPPRDGGPAAAGDHRPSGAGEGPATTLDQSGGRP